MINCLNKVIGIFLLSLSSYSLAENFSFLHKAASIDNVLVVSSNAQMSRYNESLMAGFFKGTIPTEQAETLSNVAFYNIFSNSKSKTIKNIKAAGGEVEADKIKEMKDRFGMPEGKFDRIIVLGHGEPEEKLISQTGFEISNDSTFRISTESVGKKIAPFVGENTQVEFLTCSSCDATNDLIKGLKSEGVNTFQVESTKLAFEITEEGNLVLYSEKRAVWDLSLVQWIEHGQIKLPNGSSYAEASIEERVYKESFEITSVWNGEVIKHGAGESYFIYKDNVPAKAACG